MNSTIVLVAFNDLDDVTWEYGNKFSIKYDTQSLQACKQKILTDKSEYILFWDLKNKLPSRADLKSTITSKGNLWHIGPKLGLDSLPRLLDEIQPTNMIHLNIDDSINHSSWKNTFKGCLLQRRVFEEISLSNYSNSLDVIGLDFGYKAIKSGVITRFSFQLSTTVTKEKIDISKTDELYFIRNNFDAKALIWCYLTNALKISPFVFWKTIKNINKSVSTVFNHMFYKNVKIDDYSVSIVIATLERYTVLERELKELRLLNPAVNEIIIVDQTPKEKRDGTFLNQFKDLPIVYLETDKIGQCSARNLGIKVAKSNFIWFLDDDMEEIPSNYLEKHLTVIHNLNADISCGIPDEIGTNYVDRSIPKIEISDGFPTNDVLVKKELLIAVGGFDTKMDQKQSEDQEIGLRLLKKGALSVKNNQLRIVHLRASRGGLRNHNVRKITFSSSRNSIFQRRFLHHSEIYLNLKHFNKFNIRKLLLLNVRGTFIIRGNLLQKIAKVIIGVVLLPHTIYTLRRNVIKAKKIFIE